ncbi:MAG TPA: hypothetical protein DCS93_26300 [Microscillaceae bacterium]|nr:hypothetical protein [Microscillaceae bacterium]
MKKLRYHLIIFGLFLYFSAHCQNLPKIDSLKQLLTTNLTPEHQADVLNQLARSHRYNALDQVAYYAKPLNFLKSIIIPKDWPKPMLILA